MTDDWLYDYTITEIERAARWGAEGDWRYREPYLSDPDGGE